MARGELLPVQGPPGTGKTWLAARIVADEITRARAEGGFARIGVTANSHNNMVCSAVKLSATE
jgi:KaiC/GvpD/RAD55 family RecA-like ATPase